MQDGYQVLSNGAAGYDGRARRKSGPPVLLVAGRGYFTKSISR